MKKGEYKYQNDAQPKVYIVTAGSVHWEGIERKKWFTEKPVDLVLNKVELGLPYSTSRVKEVCVSGFRV